LPLLKGLRSGLGNVTKIRAAIFGCKKGVKGTPLLSLLVFLLTRNWNWGQIFHIDILLKAQNRR